MKEIKLTQGQVALVDDDDYQILNDLKWHAMKHYNTFYTRTRIGGVMKYMHSIIMNPEALFVVDHIDGNGLNNQRSNLRICTQGQNICNSKLRKNNKSGFKGVSQYKAAKVWKDYDGPVYRARINFKDKAINLGYFKCPKEAAKARDLKAKELHGEFARLNQV